MTTPKANPSGSIKGYLDVKIPARKRKSISLFRVQVWKRRCWVVVRGDRSPAEVGASSGSRSDQVNLSVEIYTQHEGSNHPTEGTILHLDLVHKIRRAKSKSHPYAFEVCGRRGEALLYLSGTSETESQKWMSSIRSILWPPNHLETIKKNYQKSWEVSAISVGEVGSDWTSLGGLYGRLAVSGPNILVKDVHNGTTRVEWPLVSVQKVYVATGGEMEDEGRIFIVQTRPKATSPGDSMRPTYSPFCRLCALLQESLQTDERLLKEPLLPRGRTDNSRSHPCGETFLYFFSLELSDLLEGLHEAVSNLINKNGEDDTSVLSDLSELSGALSSVVVLPQRLQDPGSTTKMRKSTSVLDVSELGGPGVSTVIPRLSSSQTNLADDEIGSSSTLPTTSSRSRLLSHFRRRSMSETNLTKICLDETDEELDSRDDDLEDADLRHMDVPKDRTSSSGSYNSYRSNDSGVKLSASPSTHADVIRPTTEHGSRRFVTKSDSLDSGVRTCVKEELREPIQLEPDDQRKNENSEDKLNLSKKEKGSLEDEPDLEAKVGAWCLQSARARKSLLVKNLSTCTHRDIRKIKGLSRAMSESYKEVVDKSGVDEYKRAMENPVMTKHTTVYEEIVDVLRPLNEKKNEKEHDYEELEKCRRDIKRSYSFQEKSQPPPLPPRRPKSFSPDPWSEASASKSNALKKIFGFSFYNKSHSTDSMLEVENADFEGRLVPTSLGSDDMATVQALGTLPRIKRKSLEKNDGLLCQVSSPKMSPKQKLKGSFGISPNRSPRIPRPRNLFIFKNTGKEEQISPNTQAALKLHRQLTSQALRTPSTDSSLQDVPTPDTPKPNILSKGQGKGDQSQTETPDASEDSSTVYSSSRDPSSFLKSPKIVTKTFNFLRKFPKDKYSSLEKKRKSAVCMPPILPVDPAKVPSSFSMDNFTADEGKERPTESDKKDNLDMRPRAMSYAPASPAIQIPRRSCCYSLGTLSPNGTPTSSTFPSTGTSPHSAGPWKEDFWREGDLPLPPPAQCEPQYANLDPDPDYMTVEELRSAFQKDQDDGGYLSMGDLRTLAPSTNVNPQSEKCTQGDQHYLTMHEVHNVLSDEFPILCRQSEEFYKHRSAYPHEHGPCSSSHQVYGHHHHVPRSLPQQDEPHYSSPGYTSAPSSRKASCCDASDYLTPQEVSRLLRRELVSARVREFPFNHHHHPFHHHHHHH